MIKQNSQFLCQFSVDHTMLQIGEESPSICCYFNVSFLKEVGTASSGTKRNIHFQTFHIFIIGNMFEEHIRVACSTLIDM